MKHVVKILKRISMLSAALAIAFCTCGTASAAEIPALSDPDWNAFVTEKTEQDHTPGLSLAAVSGSDTGYKNWGFSDLESQTPVTEDTIFGIASCSKAFTALTIFLLQEEGRLSIEDSVSDYLSWWHVTWQGADQDTKIWQLLDHCSGIPNSTMMQYPDGAAQNSEIIRIAEHAELAYEPGTAFEYCNLGYNVLAGITETVSGMPFEEYVQQEILDPIGMTHSGYGIQTAQGYRWFYGRLLPYPASQYDATSGDGGMRTTAADMALWLRAQLGQTELPEKLHNAIAASHDENGHCIKMNDMMEYANGWIHYNGCLYHTGANPDFASFVLIDEQQGNGVFAVCNAWMNTADYAVNSLYQVMKGEPINREQLHAPDSIRLVDLIASGVTVFGLILFVTAVILLLTQKKRLAAKQSAVFAERKKLRRRLVLLLPLFLLTVLLPKLLLYPFGYGIVSYRSFGVWLPYSFLIGTAVLSAALLLLIIASVTRMRFYNRIDYT